MFSGKYFGKRYFGGRYFPPNGVIQQVFVTLSAPVRRLIPVVAFIKKATQRGFKR